MRSLLERKGPSAPAGAQIGDAPSRGRSPQDLAAAAERPTGAAGRRRLLGVTLPAMLACGAIWPLSFGPPADAGSAWRAGPALGLLGLLLVAVIAVRVRRRRASVFQSTRLQSTTAMISEGTLNSRRARSMLYMVLLALSLNFALQTWHARQTERRRQEESAAIELAAVQRMLSQRIARLAVSPTLSAPDADRAELLSAIARSDVEAEKLDERFTRDGVLFEPDRGELADAWRTLRVRRSALVTDARILTANTGSDDTIVTSEQRTAVAVQADGAMQAVEELLVAMRSAAERIHAARARQAQIWGILNVIILSILTVIAVEPAVRSMRRQYRRLSVQAMDLQRLALVAEQTTNAVMLVDARRRISWVNDAFTRITGLSPHDAVGQDAVALLQSSSVEADSASLLGESLAAGRGSRFQFRHRSAQGSENWLDIDVQPLRDEAGTLQGHVAVSADITQLKKAQADLRISAIAFDSLGGIIITDEDERILRVNAGFTRITGYTFDEVAGKKPGQVLGSGRHEGAFFEAIWTTLRREHHWQGEIWNRRKSGEIYPQWMSITAVRDDELGTANYVAVFTDITEKKRADETIRSLAYFDPLTRLPNRRLLRERIKGAMTASSASGRFSALLFIDLDNFKGLNDSKGHDVGDLLLIEVAKRLSAGLRSDDTVARQGGDEFVVVLTNLSEDSAHAATQVERIAEAIRREVNRPYMLGPHPYHASPSIGISLFVGVQHGVDELLKRADSAMYIAKQSGRNAYRFFDPALHAALEQRVQMEADLRKAIELQQLELNFQPQVDEQGQVRAAEVLLRWNHPTRGSVSPAQFIPLAEESELILDIGSWVLERAARQIVEWNTRTNWPPIELAVNVSARQFRDAGFASVVRDIIGRTGVEASQLKLELTESLILGNVEEVIQTMTALRALGIKLALDDFGTGQSSLSYLTRLPLDQLKIDQSFVRDLAHSRSHAIVVDTIIGLAHSLGFQVIAEGVETIEQHTMLESMGCHTHQGYLFGRPMSREQFELLVRGAEPPADAPRR